MSLIEIVFFKSAFLFKEYFYLINSTSVLSNYKCFYFFRSAKGFIHMRIVQSGEQNYLGQSDKPFDTIPDLIRHYTLNKLPVKGAEHVGLIRPLAQQIL